MFQAFAKTAFATASEILQVVDDQFLFILQPHQGDSLRRKDTSQRLLHPSEDILSLAPFPDPHLAFAMDFAALMSAQIAKTTQQQSPPPPSESNGETIRKQSPVSAQTKYLKRSEIEASREAAYLADQAARDAERIEKAEKKRKVQEEEDERNREREAKRQRLAEESKRRLAEEKEKEERARRKRLGLPPLPKEKSIEEAQGDSAAAGEDDIQDDDLISKLRELSEPARLFGESHKQRLRRFRRLTGRGSESGTPTPAPAGSKGPIPTTLEPLPEEEMKITAKLPPETDSAGRLLLSRQLTSWFTLVLREWATALAGRTVDTKMTFSGQAAANSLTQAIEHLKPLYRKLEKMPSVPSELPIDLLEPMTEIVRAAQERRYVDANDGYLKLSIGKAAWPIGVTMVGIHERSAREKLHESDKGKAHIMADEATRKILQSIKRCLSFAQTRWPPTDLGQLMG